MFNSLPFILRISVCRLISMPSLLWIFLVCLLVSKVYSTISLALVVQKTDTAEPYEGDIQKISYPATYRKCTEQC